MAKIAYELLNTPLSPEETHDPQKGTGWPATEDLLDSSFLDYPVFEEQRDTQPDDPFASSLQKIESAEKSKETLISQKEKYNQSITSVAFLRRYKS